MSEHSQDIIDIKKLKLVPDSKSPTGWSFAALDRESVGQPGIPASPFEVVMGKEIERLRGENEKLRNFLDKLRVMVRGHPSWAQDQMDWAITEFFMGEEGLPVAG